MPRRIGPRVEHRGSALVPDRPAVVDEAQGEIGLLHRISEVGWVSASPLERFAADDDSATQEGGRRTAPIGTAGADSGNVSTGGLTVVVDDPQRHDAELWIRREGLGARSQRVHLDQSGVVVEKGDDGCDGLRGSEVAAAGNAEVLGGGTRSGPDRRSAVRGLPTCRWRRPRSRRSDRPDEVRCRRRHATAAGRAPVVRMTTLTSGARSPVTP